MKRWEVSNADVTKKSLACESCITGRRSKAVQLKEEQVSATRQTVGLSNLVLSWSLKSRYFRSSRKEAFIIKHGNALTPQTKEQSKRILVVEDDVALRFALSEWFRLSGYRVYEAATADEALILLKSPVLFDLVITDVDMPGTLNGLDLVDYIDVTIPQLPVVVVSGQIQKISKRRVPFFRKPYDVKEVSALISKMLGHTAKESDIE